MDKMLDDIWNDGILTREEKNRISSEYEKIFQQAGGMAALEFEKLNRTKQKDQFLSMIEGEFSIIPKGNSAVEIKDHAGNGVLFIEEALGRLYFHVKGENLSQELQVPDIQIEESSISSDFHRINSDEIDDINAIAQYIRKISVKGPEAEAIICDENNDKPKTDEKEKKSEAIELDIKDKCDEVKPKTGENIERMANFIKAFWKDGRLDDAELFVLERKRVEMGLEKSHIFSLLQKEAFSWLCAEIKDKRPEFTIRKKADINKSLALFSFNNSKDFTSMICRVSDMGIELFIWFSKDAEPPKNLPMKKIKNFEGGNYWGIRLKSLRDISHFPDLLSYPS